MLENRATIRRAQSEKLELAAISSLSSDGSDAGKRADEKEARWSEEEESHATRSLLPLVCCHRHHRRRSAAETRDGRKPRVCPVCLRSPK